MWFISLKYCTNQETLGSILHNPEIFQFCKNSVVFFSIFQNFFQNHSTQCLQLNVLVIFQQSMIKSIQSWTMKMHYNPLAATTSYHHIIYRYYYYNFIIRIFRAYNAAAKTKRTNRIIENNKVFVFNIFF